MKRGAGAAFVLVVLAGAVLLPRYITGVSEFPVEVQIRPSVAPARGAAQAVSAGPLATPSHSEDVRSKAPTSPQGSAALPTPPSGINEREDTKHQAPAHPNEVDGAHDAGVVFEADPAGIGAAIEARLEELHACHDSWAKQDPSVPRDLQVSFVIVQASDGGGVPEVHVRIADAGLSHFAMEGCIGNVIETMRFHPPEGGGEMRVIMPLTFAATR